MPSVLTNGGKALVISRILGTGTAPTYIGVGTSSTAPAATDSALGAEVETRVNGTSSQQTTNVTNDTYRVVGTITATASRAIAEAGLFTAVSGGTLFSRSTFSVINLENGDSITLTYNFVQS